MNIKNLREIDLPISEERRKALYTAFSLAGGRYPLANNQIHTTTRMLICHGTFSDIETNIAAGMFVQDTITALELLQ